MQWVLFEYWAGYRIQNPLPWNILVGTSGRLGVCFDDYAARTVVPVHDILLLEGLVTFPALILLVPSPLAIAGPLQGLRLGSQGLTWCET